MQEKEVEEDEEDDTFDMNIKVTDPEKIGVFSQHFFCLEFLVSTISSSGLLNMFFTFYPRILNCSNSVVIEYIKCKSHVNVTLNSFYFLLKKV